MKDKSFIVCRQWKKAQAFLSPVLYFLLVLFCPRPLYANGQIHHEIRAVFHPDSQHMEVEDQIILPASLRPGSDGRFHFLLHEGLALQSETPGVSISRETDAPDVEGFDSEVPLAHYALSLPVGLRVFVLHYQGEIHHPIRRGEGDAAQEEQSPGIISSNGIFLSGRSLWLPWFYTDLVTFSLNVALPSGWQAVSQGMRTAFRSEGDAVAMRWESPEPQEEIFLLAGRWTEYRRDAGRVTAMVFLRAPDPDLAKRYLESTEQYIEMYQDLIGPYPYKKFALLEGFWEGRTGMPSMTLLGPKRLRFPLSVQNVHPHEILHNWWGNGVFVDDVSGDWSEGLTHYLSDYLVQEQKGMGQVARRAALQKYADYLSDNEDIPLNAFQSREAAWSQAVGVGKSSFLFHMLRLDLGDKIFIQSLRTFFHDFRYKRAAFDDLIRSFNRTSGKDLSQIFSQWVYSPGAPVLRVRRVHAEATASGYRLSASIQQEQAGPPYVLDIPIAVTLDTREAEAFQTTISMVDKTMDLELMLPARPIHMTLDPEFDLFENCIRRKCPPRFLRF